MGLSLNTSDPLYPYIVQCVCVQDDHATVVDLANPSLTFTRNASGTTNVVSNGSYAYGWGLDGDGSYNAYGWAVGGTPPTLPGGSTSTDISVFVALNSFTSANNIAYFIDNGGSNQLLQVGVRTGKDALYESAATVFATGTDTIPTATALTLLSTWRYNGGAGYANVYYNGSSTPDISGTAGPNGSNANLMANLGTTSGQGSLKASVAFLVIFDHILTGSDFQRLTNSLTGGGAFALIEARACAPAARMSNGHPVLSGGRALLSCGILPLAWVIERRNKLGGRG